MTWFRVDDGFSEHPRLEALEKDPRLLMAAITVWVFMGADCARRLTDGRCSIARVRKVCFAIKTEAIRGAEALVAVGLWDRTSDGYAFRHWGDYQPSKQDVKRLRAAKTARQRRWRERLQDGAVDASTRASVDASRDAGEVSAPSRPDPDQEELRSGEGGAVTAEAFRADTRAREPSRPLSPTLSEWSAERQSTAFRKAYLAARQTDPSMGGKQVGDFHKRVVETAKARGTTAESLFKEVLDRWLSRDLNDREKSSPYACFANAFGELVDRQASGLTPELRKMREQVQEAVRIVRSQ